MNIILASEEEELSSALSFQLRDHGIQSLLCCTDKDLEFALNRADSLLLLIEHGFFGFSALEISAKIQKSGDVLPMVFLTSRPTETEKREILESGAIACLDWNISLRDLGVRIYEVLIQNHPSFLDCTA